MNLTIRTKSGVEIQLTNVKELIASTEGWKKLELKDFQGIRLNPELTYTFIGDTCIVILGSEIDLLEFTK